MIKDSMTFALFDNNDNDRQNNQLIARNTKLSY